MWDVVLCHQAKSFLLLSDFYLSQDSGIVLWNFLIFFISLLPNFSCNFIDIYFNLFLLSERNIEIRKKEENGFKQ